MTESEPESESIREAIEARGARVLYTPAYSPDVNAIELCWSKLKSLLKAVGARTAATLRKAITRAARQIRTHDAVAWIDHVLAQLKGSALSVTGSDAQIGGESPHRNPIPR